MILTIAKHTFREAIRKKIVHLLIGLGIIIIAISPYIPTTDEPDAKVKMIFVVFFQVVALLCIIGIILLSASSLPNEIEDKTIYGILSKPISRLKIVAGKIAGFAALSALMIVVLGLFNAAVIHRVALRLPQDYSGIVKARGEYRASQFSIQGSLHHSRQGIQWIEGGRTGVAVWRFSGLGNKGHGRLPFEAELVLKIENSRGLDEAIPLMVRVENAVTGLFKTEIVSARIDVPLTVKIDPQILQKCDAVNVSVFPINKAHYVGATQGNVKLYLVQERFAFNYAKALAITFLKFVLIVAIGVMGSTYLSAPVSIAATFVVFLCGHVLDFVKDFSLLIQHGHTHEEVIPGAVEKPHAFLVFLDYLMRKPLEWLSVVLPDFKKFDSLKFLLKGIDIPWETVGFSFGYTALYAGVCLGISSLLFKKREFF